MKEYQSLSHTRWDCNCRLGFIPKKSKKKIADALQRHLGETIRDLAKQKESQGVKRHMIGGMCACAALN
ncbi:MAG: hypothetical protein ACTS6J_08175 [Burkholderiales bacterium]